MLLRDTVTVVFSLRPLRSALESTSEVDDELLAGMKITLPKLNEVRVVKSVVRERELAEPKST